MLIQSGAFDPDADKDLQTELDVGPQQSSTDIEEAADGAAAVATGAAVPSTPPQEAVEPGGPPGAAGQPPAAAAAANGTSKAADAGKGAHPKGEKAKVRACLVIRGRPRSLLCIGGAEEFFSKCVRCCMLQRGSMTTM